ncbi:hypothetical protein [Planctopirus limnophila]|uniref:hypothetical protein n=1 Tax=Planctopirus limnophila TaxID=120 RepID=UPI0002ED1F97|nr:hypothetical protein [Planctopirus limnophila]
MKNDKLLLDSLKSLAIYPFVAFCRKVATAVLKLLKKATPPHDAHPLLHRVHIFRRSLFKPS